MQPDWQKALKDLNAALELGRQARTELQTWETETAATLAKYLRAEGGGELDPEAVKALITRPYTLIPIDEHEAWLIQARAVKMPMVGWLVAQEAGFNKFRVTRSMDLLTPLPGWMKEELGWRPPEHQAQVDGTHASLSVTQGDEGTFKKKYGAYLGAKQADGTFKIRGGDAWIRLVAQLVRDGILPYTPQPVSPEHWDPGVQDLVTLRDYQVRAVDEFLAKGAVLVNYPPGAGKTIIGCHIFNHFRGRILLLADTVILCEQWQDRIGKFAPHADVTISTYQGAQKYLDREWDLLVPDEAQRLPATTFSRLAFIKTKYRLGLSGTPWREDDRQHLIVALSGFPIAIRWAEFVASGILKRPRIVIATVASDAAKTTYVRELLARRKGRTLVFCDWIEQGQALADSLDLPFIHGETRHKLERLQESEAAVVSRIGDRGLDFPDLQLVVEVAYAGAAREQFAQRVGRLLHGAFEGEFHTVFTPEEAEKFRPRIFGVEAELAGEVDIEFVNVGAVAEPRQKAPLHHRPSTSLRMSRRVAIPSASHPSTGAQEQSDLDLALANPAVRKLVLEADDRAGVKNRGYVEKAIRAAWDSPVSLEEIRAGKGIGEQGVRRYKAGFREAQKAGLVTVLEGGRYLADRARIKKLIELSQRFKK